MIKFSNFLTEASTTSSEEKLTHLEHAEDHPINAGAAGFQHAKKTLMGVHKALQGEKSNVSLTTKYDGSPSIVFGHHPETGKFFVASKSAFNKDPKINYNQADIEKNHGHAPGLVAKLSAALKHLPKVTPKAGVYQGDIMHSGGSSGDVKMHGGEAHFTPNTITYSTKKKGEAEQAAKSKIGVAIHTAYTGPSFDKLKANYNAGHQGFGEHKDVHLMDVTHETAKSKYTPTNAVMFQQHMDKAEEAHKELEKSGGYKTIEPHTDHLKTYINKTVRTGATPSVEGYKAHVTEIHQKLADKVSTPAKKTEKINAGKQLTDHIDANKQHFQKTFDLHHHLQQAKDQLVHGLSSHTSYAHTIGNKASKPEGFVAVVNNRPTKLVHRTGEDSFSAANFAKNAK